MNTERTRTKPPRHRIAMTVCVFVLWALAGTMTARAQVPYFRLTILDDQTNQGVPGVKITLTNQMVFMTDSAGVVAFYRPDLMGKVVWFGIQVPGYTPPKGAIGNYPGAALTTTPGGSGVIRITRDNLATRMYRVTGASQYQDSELLGDAPPQMQDPSSSPVMTQRNGESVVYNGRAFWLGNDTTSPDASSENLRGTCATAALPSDGGLDPETGVNLEYFREGDTVKPMIDAGFDWVRAGCLRVAMGDVGGSNTLLANYTALGPAGNAIERGLLQFDDATEVFEKVVAYPANALMIPDGTATPYTDTEGSWFYYANPWPTVRTQSSAVSIRLLAHQGLTCLKPGSKLDYTQEQLDRDENDRLLWGWAAGTSPIGEAECETLVARGLISPDEQWLLPTDIESETRVHAESGTICWNEYRQRWIAICNQTGGATPHGEVWYFEGDTPLGPWVYGQKIVTSFLDDSIQYSFLDPAQHPELDKEDGRYIFFDGTFTKDLTTTRFALPRYNGNRLMFRIDLADSRMFLPVPVYRVEGTPAIHRTKTDIPDGEAARVPLWFAHDRRRGGLTTIYEYPDPAHDTVVLSAELVSPTGQPGTAVFYSLAATATDVPHTVPLNEFVHETSGQRIYTTSGTVEELGYVKSASPVCLVWENPIPGFNPYDLAIKTQPPGWNSGGMIVY